MAELRYCLHGIGIRVAAEAPASLVARLAAFLSYLGLDADADPTAAEIEVRVVVGEPTPEAANTAWSPVAGMGFSVLAGGGTIAARADGATVVVEPEAGRATLTVAAAAAAAGRLHANLVSYAVLTLLRERELYPLHAAGAVWRGSGLLLVADSGAGKSTLAVALLASGWSLLSDDSLLLAPGADGVAALALRRDLLLSPGSGLPAQQLAPGPPADAGKLRLDLRACYPRQAAERCVPRALVFPERVATGPSRLAPCPPGEAFALLAHHGLVTELPTAGAARHLAALAALVRQCSSHRLLAAPDLLDDRSLATRLLAPLCENAAHER